MPQEKIQAWIKRIPIYIQEVIKCDGNNLYKEGPRESLLIRVPTGVFDTSGLKFPNFIP
jgi:hypothetical protein